MKEDKKNKINNFQTIISPFVTEKSTSLLNKNNKNVFIVNSKANKNQIKSAIQNIFGDEVASVNTKIIKKKGKSRLKKAKLSKIKTAIVTLKKNKKIDLFNE